MCLSCGTSLERIAAESLTRGLFPFVHGDISRHSVHQLQDQVAERLAGKFAAGRFINSCPSRVPIADLLRTRTVRGGSLRVWLRDELGGLEHADAEWRRNRNPVRDHQP